MTRLDGLVDQVPAAYRGVIVRLIEGTYLPAVATVETSMREGVPSYQLQRSIATFQEAVGTTMAEACLAAQEGAVQNPDVIRRQFSAEQLERNGFFQNHRLDRVQPLYEREQEAARARFQQTAYTILIGILTTLREED